MKDWDMIHKIKALHDDGQGLSIRAISKELGVSRNTVRKYLRLDETSIQASQLCRQRVRITSCATDLPCKWIRCRLPARTCEKHRAECISDRLQ